MHTPITSYEKTSFTGPLDRGHELTRPVYTRGPERGGQVLVIQELPGIMPETLRLCDKLVEAGFRVTPPRPDGEG